MRQVTITGQNFQSETGKTLVLSVKFGTLEVTFSVISATKIIASVPSQPPGSVIVYVTTVAGVAMTKSYTYTIPLPIITSVVPDTDGDVG